MMTNITELNRALLHFHNARSRGATNMKWFDFQKQHLHKTFNYVLSRQALGNHLRECLNVDAD